MTDTEITEGQSQTSLEVEVNGRELDKEPDGTKGVASVAADAAKAASPPDGSRERDRHGQTPEEPQQGAGDKDKDKNKDKKKTAVGIHCVLHSVLIIGALAAHGVTVVFVVKMLIAVWPCDTDPLLRLLSSSVLLTAMCLNVLVLHIVVRAVAEQQQRIWRDRNTSK